MGRVGDGFVSWALGAGAGAELGGLAPVLVLVRAGAGAGAGTGAGTGPGTGTGPALALVVVVVVVVVSPHWPASLAAPVVIGDWRRQVRSTGARKPARQVQGTAAPLPGEAR